MVVVAGARPDERGLLVGQESEMAFLKSGDTDSNIPNWDRFDPELSIMSPEFSPAGGCCRALRHTVPEQFIFREYKQSD